MRHLIENLRAEHHGLRLAIRILRAMAAQVVRGGDFPTDDCARLLTYLQDLVVDVHFQKETQTLLPAVTMFGNRRDVEAAGKVLRAQEHAKELLHTLVLFREPAGDLTPVERRAFFDTVQALGSCLERGMILEERRLFGSIPRLPGDDRLGWLQRFSAIEAGRRSNQDWLRELAAIALRWPVA